MNASTPHPSPSPTGNTLEPVLHGNPFIIIVIIVAVLFIYGIFRTFAKEAR